MAPSFATPGTMSLPKNLDNPPSSPLKVRTPPNATHFEARGRSSPASTLLEVLRYRFRTLTCRVHYVTTFPSSHGSLYTALTVPARDSRATALSYDARHIAVAFDHRDFRC